MRSGNEQHGVAMPRLLLLTGVILLLADYSFAQASPDPNPNAMPANKVGRSSIWIRRCQAARPRDLWTRSCKDGRQMFHERKGETLCADSRTDRCCKVKTSTHSPTAKSGLVLESSAYWRTTEETAVSSGTMPALP